MNLPRRKIKNKIIIINKSYWAINYRVVSNCLMIFKNKMADKISPELGDLRNRADQEATETVEKMDEIVFEKEKEELLAFKTEVLDVEIGCEVDVKNDKGDVTGKEFKPGTLWGEIYDMCKDEASFKGLSENKCGL